MESSLPSKVVDIETATFGHWLRVFGRLSVTQLIDCSKFGCHPAKEITERQAFGFSGCVLKNNEHNTH